MEVRVVCLCVLLLFGVMVDARNVKSRPDNFEDTYGEVADGDDGLQNDDYDDNYGEEDTGIEPTDDGNDTARSVTGEFRSKPEEFYAKIGDLVKLPCEVTNTDIILMWKKNYLELLYQDEIAMTPMPNVKKTKEGLEVKVTSEGDYGTYSCVMTISPHDNPKITHTIKPLSPPTIHSIYTADNKTVYNVGEKLQLTCNASGTPPIKISWVKDSEGLEPKGKTLTIPHLKPKNGGFYRCLADNGIEPAQHSYININIQHKPEVSVDKYLVNSDHEKDAELTCTVHAYPPAIINWQKDGVNIANSPRTTLKKHKDSTSYNLLITNLTETDFGRYTCTAKNSIGKGERNVSLVRIPTIHALQPEKKNREVIVTWKVESKSPIIEHQLQYRKKGQDSWKHIKPNITAHDKDTYNVKYTLMGLDADTYEVRTRSKNAHGWSEYSETIDFEGVPSKHSPHHKPHKKHKENEQKEKSVAFSPQASPPARHQDKEPAIQEKSIAPATQATPAVQKESDPTTGASEKTSASASMISSIPLTSIALLILCFRQ